jgi:hypothetical protein
MNLLRPVSALLISMKQRADGLPRRRLFVTGSAAAAIETPVRVTKMTIHGCFIADLEDLPNAFAQTWLKLPGKEPLRILAEPAPGGGLTCSFAQPLYPAELDALLAHGAPEFRRSERRPPRCTLL